MGNEQATQQKQDSNFIINFNDPNILSFMMSAQTIQFGEIQIYKLNVKPYDYIMQYQLTHLKGQSNFVAQIKYYKQLPKHRNIVAVEHMTVDDQKQMCIQLINLKLYCKYYNFTIEDAINLKLRKKHKQNGYYQNKTNINKTIINQEKYNNSPNKKHKTISQISTFTQISHIKFSQSDLWYILQSLIDVAQTYYKKYSQSFSNFNPKYVFLSPQGYIKVYLLNFSTNHQVACKKSQYNVSNKKINNDKMPHQSIFGLEQKNQLTIYLGNKSRLNQNQIQTNRQKCDIFDIGLLILSLINLDQISQYFDKIMKPKIEFINYNVNNIDKKGVSNQMKSMLKSMLCNKKNRNTAQQIISTISRLKNDEKIKVSVCVRLDEEDQNQEQFNSLRISPNKANNNRFLSIQRILGNQKEQDQKIKPKIINLIPGKIQIFSSKAKSSRILK